MAHCDTKKIKQKHLDYLRAGYLCIVRVPVCPDFPNIITLEMLEGACLDKGELCSFSYHPYSVLAHKCADRCLWEVHIYEHDLEVMCFTILR